MGHAKNVFLDVYTAWGKIVSKSVPDWGQSVERKKKIMNLTFGTDCQKNYF